MHVNTTKPDYCPRISVRPLLYLHATRYKPFLKTAL